MSEKKVIATLETQKEAYRLFKDLQSKGKKLQLERIYCIDEKSGKIKQLFIIEELS